MNALDADSSPDNNNNNNNTISSIKNNNTQLRKMQRQPSAYRIFEWQPILRIAWLIHFVGCILVLFLGTTNNNNNNNNNLGERKYIPINVAEVKEECYKGFVDVFSSSIDEPGAFICCTGSYNDSMICGPPPRYLFFAQRLARFPDAWLLPLFPLFVRGAIELFRILSQTSHSYNYGGGGAHTPPKAENIHARRRFSLYIALIQIRGWVLYLMFDKIEEFFVSSAAGTTATTATTECWYKNLLDRRYNNNNYEECPGKTTDFSDHVVLYFAQILPIALMEVLHSFVVPFWDTTTTTTTTTTIKSPTRNTNIGSLSALFSSSSSSWIPVLLILWLANLYIVTFLGAYKTSVYFHTGIEIFAGYMVSLCIQIPLFLLQCTLFFPQARAYFYGHGLS